MLEVPKNRGRDVGWREIFLNQLKPVLGHHIEKRFTVSYPSSQRFEGDPFDTSLQFPQYQLFTGLRKQ
jgi:hypothetical protein